jgi:hypothetical protein
MFDGVDIDEKWFYQTSDGKHSTTSWDDGVAQQTGYKRRVSTTTVDKSISSNQRSVAKGQMATT